MKELKEKIISYAKAIPAEIVKDDKVISFAYVIAQRKAFLTRKKLKYLAQVKIDEKTKEVFFTEMLKETGLGLSTGTESSDISPGLGFKVEKYNTLSGTREGSIKEQSEIFSKVYKYDFDYTKHRKAIETIARESGYKFIYRLTSFGF